MAQIKVSALRPVNCAVFSSIITTYVSYRERAFFKNKIAAWGTKRKSCEVMKKRDKQFQSNATNNSNLEFTQILRVLRYARPTRLTNEELLLEFLHGVHGSSRHHHGARIPHYFLKSSKNF
jgi:hypothetical protein